MTEFTCCVVEKQFNGLQKRMNYAKNVDLVLVFSLVFSGAL